MLSLKRTFACALLLAFAALPLSSAVCELICLSGNHANESPGRAGGCHREAEDPAAEKGFSLGGTLGGSCTHLTSAPGLLALKRVSEEKRSITLEDAPKVPLALEGTALRFTLHFERAIPGIAVPIVTPLRI